MYTKKVFSRTSVCTLRSFNGFPSYFQGDIQGPGQLAPTVIHLKPWQITACGSLTALSPMERVG